MGRGHLVAFAEDPNFRGFAEMTQLLFMNAVLLGPGHYRFLLFCGRSQCSSLEDASFGSP
jgi:hypothetical protein